VPEPDIWLHFPIQRVRILNQVPKALMQNLILKPQSMTPLGDFLKRNNRVTGTGESPAGSMARAVRRHDRHLHPAAHRHQPAGRVVAGNATQALFQRGASVPKTDLQGRSKPS